MVFVSGNPSIALRSLKLAGNPSIAPRFLKLAGTHAERRRFPAAAPDTMPLMIDDVDIGSGAPPQDTPELAAAPLLPTANIPRNTEAPTILILLRLRFIVWSNIVGAQQTGTITDATEPIFDSLTVCSDRCQ